MAKAPVYDGEKAKPSPLPGVRFAAGATGASFGGTGAKQLGEEGAALEQVAAVAGRIALANQKTINDTKSEDNFNQWNGAMNEEFARDFELRKGRDAGFLHEYAKNKGAELKKKFSEDLDNDRQRELFEKAVDRAMVGYQNKALGLEQRELGRARENVGRQTIKQVWENAVFDRNDPALLAVSLMRGEAKIKEKVPTLSEYQGMGKDVVNAGIAKNIDILYSGVVDSYVADGDPRKAWTFFKENREKFDKSTAPRREAGLKKMAEVKAIENLAARYAGSELDLGERLEEARDIVKVSQKTELPISSEGARVLDRSIKATYGEEVGLRKLEAQKGIDAVYKNLVKEFQLPTGKDGIHFSPAYAEEKIKQVQDIEFPSGLPESVRVDLEKRRKNFINTTMWKLGKEAKPGRVTDPVQLLELYAMEPEELNKIPKHKWMLDSEDFNDVFNYSQGVTSGKGQAFDIQSRAKWILDAMKSSPDEFPDGKDADIEGIERKAKMATWLRKQVKLMPPGDAFKPEELGKVYSRGMQYVKVRRPRDEDVPLRGNLLDFATEPRTVKVRRYELDSLIRDEGINITLDDVPENLQGFANLKTSGKKYYADINVPEKGPVRRVWDIDGVFLKDNAQPKELRPQWEIEVEKEIGGIQ